MPSDRRDAQPYQRALELTDQEERQMIDSLIDDMGAQSFPASDPPAWGAVSSRLAETEGRPRQFISVKTPPRPP